MDRHHDQATRTHDSNEDEISHDAFDPQRSTCSLFSAMSRSGTGR